MLCLTSNYTPVYAILPHGSHRKRENKGGNTNYESFPLFVGYYRCSMIDNYKIIIALAKSL